MAPFAMRGILTQWLQTLEHADHARSRARNEATVQLCQPPLPKSGVRGVVGVRVFAVRALLLKGIRNVRVYSHRQVQRKCLFHQMSTISDYHFGEGV